MHKPQPRSTVTKRLTTNRRRTVRIQTDPHRTAEPRHAHRAARPCERAVQRPPPHHEHTRRQRNHTHYKRKQYPRPTNPTHNKTLRKTMTLRRVEQSEQSCHHTSHTAITGRRFPDCKYLGERAHTRYRSHRQPHRSSHRHQPFPVHLRRPDEIRQTKYRSHQP